MFHRYNLGVKRQIIDQNKIPNPTQQMSKANALSKLSCCSPRYWSTWSLILCAYLIAYCPLRIQFALGRLFGKLLASNRKLSHIASTNISRCLPQLERAQQQSILKKYFKNQGVDLLETLTIWCRDGFKLFDQRVDVEGLDHLKDALDKNRGVILLSSHFSNVDMGGMLMAYLGDKHKLFRFSGTYQEQPNKLFDRFMTRGREQYFDDLIAVGNSRRIARELKDGKIVWYAPDMNVASKNAVFVPFFGIPAATTTAISRLAKLGNAIVIPYAHYRVSDKHRYRVKIFPALTDFPSDDTVFDTQRVNRQLEDLVLEKPENYWWILKRFKTRPAGEEPFY